VAVGLAIAGLVGTRIAVREADRRNALVLHTLDVIGDAEHLARRASDAQSALRGYLLLGDPQLLERFTEASQAFSTLAIGLKTLTSDNPVQVVRANAMREAFDTWHEIAVIVSKQTTLDDTARERLRDGAVAMTKLRADADAFVSHERTLLSVRRDASARAGWWTNLGVLIAIAAAVLLACVTSFSIALRVARDAERIAIAAAAVAEGDLARRVDVTGKDELARASAAFNAMAEGLHRQHEDEVALSRMRDMLHASHSTEEAHSILARLAPQCLEAPATRLYTINASRNLLAPAVAWGDESLLPKIDEGFAPERCWALRNGRTHVVRDPARDVPCNHREDQAGPSVCLPLIAQGETVGVLYMVVDERPRLADDVGEMIGLTLANLRLREVLRNQAIRDPLTGLFNRRYLEETLSREVSRVRRKQAELAVIVLDVDHFKRFNDTYGHAGGDAMLREVGSVLNRSFRESDIVCRFGGEEFVVVAPECSLEAATARTEDMRNRVREISITVDGRKVSGVTMSAGISMFPKHGDGPDALFQAADRAVYRSKSEGRDRITAASVQA
jgi:diguanylate cyclase (GGDEF)-like protein